MTNSTLVSLALVAGVGFWIYNNNKSPKIVLTESALHSPSTLAPLLENKYNVPIVFDLPKDLSIYKFKDSINTSFISNGHIVNHSRPSRHTPIFLA
jgi:hypothetical protein